MINGCVLDEKINKLFVFGKYLTEYDLSLSTKIDHSSEGSDFIYEICYFFKDISVCK